MVVHKLFYGKNYDDRNLFYIYKFDIGLYLLTNDKIWMKSSYVSFSDLVNYTSIRKEILTY